MDSFKWYTRQVRWATAADPDGPGDRIGVTDGKAEGFFFLDKAPPGWQPFGDVDRETMTVRGKVPL